MFLPRFRKNSKYRLSLNLSSFKNAIGEYEFAYHLGNERSIFLFLKVFGNKSEIVMRIGLNIEEVNKKNTLEVKNGTICTCI